MVISFQNTLTHWNTENNVWTNIWVPVAQWNWHKISHHIIFIIFLLYFWVIFLAVFLGVTINILIYNNLVHINDAILIAYKALVLYSSILFSLLCDVINLSSYKLLVYTLYAHQHKYIVIIIALYNCLLN